MPSVLQHNSVKNIREAPNVDRTSRSAELLSGEDAFCVPFVFPLVAVEAKCILTKFAKDTNAMVQRKSQQV
jgi:hypothetical protein